MMSIDPRDRKPQGEPDTIVLLPTGSLVGLRILGVLGNITLGIREDREGYPVSCVVTDAFGVDTWQSNPRRVAE